MADHWDEPLTLPIRLNRRRTGVTLETLRDAAEFMLAQFGTVTHDIALKDAVEELMHAAHTGLAADIREATQQVSRVLEFNKLV